MILLPRVPEIAARLQEQLSKESSLTEKSQMEVDLSNNQIMDCGSGFDRREILMVNMKTLESICLHLCTYLENNELANVDDLKKIHETMAQVFPNSLAKPFIPSKVAADAQERLDDDGQMELDMFDNQMQDGMQMYHEGFDENADDVDQQQ